MAAWSMSPLLAQPLISISCHGLVCITKKHVLQCLPLKSPSPKRRKSHGSGCQWPLCNIPPMVKALPPEIGSCSAKQSLKTCGCKTLKKYHITWNTLEFKSLKMFPNRKVLLLCSMILRPLLPWFWATPLLALACYVLHTHQSAK